MKSPYDMCKEMQELGKIIGKRAKTTDKKILKNKMKKARSEFLAKNKILVLVEVISIILFIAIIVYYFKIPFYKSSLKSLAKLGLFPICFFQIYFWNKMLRYMVKYSA